MKRIIITFTLIFAAATLSFGQDDSAYKNTLKEMMDVSGATESYKVAIVQTFKMLKEQKSKVPDEVWTHFEKSFLDASQEELLGMLVPIYQKHISLPDLKAIIAFYQSPAGKRFSEKTPLIMQESMQAGQQWGMRLTEQFDKKLKEKGY
ncbi:hypothetical protein SAMN05421820_103705 [Pedobacter steynii]|uniref:DUF2059 domain-containing protein n=1 Tax=Pedobacter steynii TaxID=430522 RepID=A0A1G9STW2_9SPHI|nr:DUF2059 domain-containing protein [Pedobacter steynii]NQX37322.1 DUF2059 domain-containing protein [Pedobacter steynii]SDM38919.1 hypothetical protein SAMN05421820_103705 [Pedobacter steynii]